MHSKWDSRDMCGHDYMPNGSGYDLQCCDIPKPEKCCIKTWKSCFKLYKICHYRVYIICPHCNCEYDYRYHRGCCPKCGSRY